MLARAFRAYFLLLFVLAVCCQRAAQAVCPALTAPPFGSATILAPASPGQVCLFSCNAGYSLLGTSARTCLASGAWSGSGDQECEPLTCSMLPPVLNGVIVPAAAPVASAAVYVCNAGYATLGGSTARTCSAVLSYNGTAPTCAPTTCAPALTAPENGRLIGACLNTTDSFCVFGCNAGFVLSNAAAPVRKCQSDGSYSGFTPSCLPQPCLLPLAAPPNGRVSMLIGVQGDVAQFTCDAGYALSGDAERHCLAGMWNGTATQQCLALSCTPLGAAPTDGLLIAPSDVVGATASYSCNTGFVLTAGAAVRVCQPSLVWSGLAPTCAPAAPAACPPLAAVANGVTTAPAGALDGHLADVTCNAGYTRSAGALPVCSAGAWTPSPVLPSCDANPCQALAEPANGTASFGTALTGSVASFACNAGFTLVGTASRVCLADGTYSGTQALCLANACAPSLPPVLANGAVSNLAGVTGSTSMFACNAGFALRGAASLVCTASGSWSAAVPSCERLNCSALSAPANGFIASLSSSSPGSPVVATFACNAGYTLFGAVSRTCQETGTWTGLAMQQCLPNACSPYIGAASPTNGQLICTGVRLGATCNATCNAGFRLFGTAMRVCSASGAWIGRADARCSEVLASASTVSLAEPLAPAPAGTPLVFLLTVRNASGVIVPSSDELIATAFAPVPGAPVGGGLATYTFNGQYSVATSFPLRVGAYNLTILVNGEPTRAAPYLVTVIAGPPDALTSSIVGFNSSFSEIGVPISFTVQVRDAFGNAQSGAISVAYTTQQAGASTALAVELLGGGRYAAALVPVDGGVYKIAVLLAGQDVARSPLVVYVDANCTRGTYAVESTGPCVACPIGSFGAAFGLTQCEPCPAATTTLGPGAVAATDCTCFAGAFRPRPGAACEPCLVGGVCAGGEAAPVALPGYYALRVNVLAPCRLAAACLGANRCSAAYRGVLCASCTPQHYLSLGEVCLRCGAWGKALLPLLFGGAFVVFSALVLVTVFCVARSDAWAAAALLEGTARKGPASSPAALAAQPTRIGVAHSLGGSAVHAALFAQSAALLLDTPFPWPRTVRTVLRLFDLVNLSPFALPATCANPGLLPRLLAFTLYPTMLIPALGLGVAACFVGERLGLPNTGGRLARQLARTVVLRTLCMTVPLLYLPVLRSALAPFVCMQLRDGVFYVVADTSVVCGSPAWRAAATAGGVIGALALVLPPAGLAWGLYGVRGALDDPGVRVAWLSMFSLLRRRAFWLPLMLMVKRACIVLTIALLVHSPVFLALALQSLLVGGMLLHYRLAPYRLRSHNLCELLFAGGLAVLATLGALFYFGSWPSSGWRRLFTGLMLCALFTGMAVTLGFAVFDAACSLVLRSLAAPNGGARDRATGSAANLFGTLASLDADARLTYASEALDGEAVAAAAPAAAPAAAAELEPGLTLEPRERDLADGVRRTYAERALLAALDRDVRDVDDDDVRMRVAQLMTRHGFVSDSSTRAPAAAAGKALPDGPQAAASSSSAREGRGARRLSVGMDTLMLTIADFDVDAPLSLASAPWIGALAAAPAAAGADGAARSPMVLSDETPRASPAVSRRGSSSDVESV